MSEPSNNGDSRRRADRIKSVAIVVVVLIIGMVLGGLITARLVQKRIETFTQMRSERGFTRFLEGAIQYDSEEQREQVEAILEATSERMFEHFSATRFEARQILEETRAELRQILRPEQMRQLERQLRQRMPRNGPMGPRMRPGERPGKRRGPPPPPPGN